MRRDAAEDEAVNLVAVLRRHADQSSGFFTGHVGDHLARPSGADDSDLDLVVGQLLGDVVEVTGPASVDRVVDRDQLYGAIQRLGNPQCGQECPLCLVGAVQWHQHTGDGLRIVRHHSLRPAPFARFDLMCWVRS